MNNECMELDSGRGTFNLDEICRALSANVLCGEDQLDTPVRRASGCDLMSDVLAFTEPESILLTGLTNQQVIRTAEILDLKAIVFVRGKKPDEKVIATAREIGIPLLSSPFPLYESCGLLFSMGLKGKLSFDKDHVER